MKTDCKIKTCTKCGKTKDISEFPSNKRDGVEARCTDCKRIYSREYSKRTRRDIGGREIRLYYAYGISIEDFNKIFENQGSACFICRTTTPTKLGWVVDHDHKTGKIRGILCSGCNTAIGHLKEDTKIIQRCLAYLRYHSRSGPFKDTYLWQGIPPGGIKGTRRLNKRKIE